MMGPVRSEDPHRDGRTELCENKGAARLDGHAALDRKGISTTLA